MSERVLSIQCAYHFEQHEGRQKMMMRLLMLVKMKRRTGLNKVAAAAGGLS